MEFPRAKTSRRNTRNLSSSPRLGVQRRLSMALALVSGAREGSRWLDRRRDGADRLGGAPATALAVARGISAQTVYCCWRRAADRDESLGGAHGVALSMGFNHTIGSSAGPRSRSRWSSLRLGAWTRSCRVRRARPLRERMAWAACEPCARCHDVVSSDVAHLWSDCASQA